VCGSLLKRPQDQAPTKSLSVSHRMRITAVLSSAALSIMSNTNTKNTKNVAMHWFRKGLRLQDNPALLHALETAKKTEGGRLYPVYVMDGDCYQLKHCSALKANFLVECLIDLDKSLKDVGSRLYVVSGDPTKELPALWENWDVTHLTFEADETGEPYAKARDESVMNLCNEKDIEVKSFCSETIFSLEDYVKKSGNLAKVPATMGKFQGIFGKMGKVPNPLNAPTKEDFKPIIDKEQTRETKGKMLPPKRATDLPWPRDTPKADVTPNWGPKDCKNLTPITRGGESKAQESLSKSMAKATWVAGFEKPKTSCTSYVDPCLLFLIQP